MLKEPVVFAQGYRLDSVEILPEFIRFPWIAEEDVTLLKRVAVHFLDVNEKMRGHLDNAIETGYRSAVQGEGWSNYAATNGDDFRGVSSFGVAIYDNKGMKTVLEKFKSQSDWNGSRLLISLDGNVTLTAIRSDDFASKFSIEDVLCEWSAGGGARRFPWRVTEACL